jgi:hypothetical protein
MGHMLTQINLEHAQQNMIRNDPEEENSLNDK